VSTKTDKLSAELRAKVRSAYTPSCATATHDGAANLFAAAFAGEARWVQAEKAWYLAA
jgi:hypothetical protein